jgi:hypothetical protein
MSDLVNFKTFPTELPAAKKKPPVDKPAKPAAESRAAPARAAPPAVPVKEISVAGVEIPEVDPLTPAASQPSKAVAVPLATEPAPCLPVPVSPLDRFDEVLYLRTHQDVAQAVARGNWPSGLMHYAITGRSKGRLATPDVDTEWYGATYPAAVSDVAAGRVASLEDHYFAIGRYRGYLPSASAPRLDDPSRCRSRYGGLWTDHGNALDIVEGKRDLGIITADQAVLLHHWITRGYVVLPQAIAADVLDAAQGDLEKAYGGLFPDMRFAVHTIGQKVAWLPEARTSPAKALDLHWYSQATRNLIFAPAVLDFLHLIFERRAMATQTLGFWRGSQQNAHQDSAYVNYSLPMQFAASWIALEDVVEGAGELFYHVGSHRIAEYRFNDRYKGTEEAARQGVPRERINHQIDEQITRIGLQAEGLGLETGKLLARRGDVLIWAADLAHGGSIISERHTRKSMVTHYCPAECVPSYFETRSRTIMPHGKTAFYASGHYS